MNQTRSPISADERKAFAKRFRLPPNGLALTRCQVDPFPYFRHPSESLRDWAWQPLNKFADYWHQCYVGFADVARARQALDAATTSHERYEAGLTLCTRTDALVELVQKFHKALMKRQEVIAEEAESLRALAAGLEPKVPSVAYVNRMRNKRASHIEVPESADHPGVLTWEESRLAYDGVFDVQAIEQVISTLTAYIQEASVLGVHEWFRFSSEVEFQTWLPMVKKAGAIALLTPMMLDRMKTTRGMTLSSVAALERTDTFFTLRKAELVVLPIASSSPSAPKESAHSVVNTWRIEAPQ